MKKIIEKLFFKILKSFFTQNCFWIKKYNLISLEFFILRDLIFYIGSCFYNCGFVFLNKYLSLISKIFLQIEFAKNWFSRLIYLYKNFKYIQKFYWQFLLFLVDKYEIILKLFFNKKDSQLLFKNFFLISIAARLKQVYFVIIVDYFYRQKNAITRIFLAYFYNLFYINYKN